MAFPTNGVLDTFDRTAENPLSFGGAWSGPIWNGDPQLSTTGTELQQGPLSGGDNYWNSTFGADQEAYVTVSGLPGEGKALAVYLRVQSPGTGSETFIAIVFNRLAGTDTISVMIGTAETLKLTVNQDMATGDSFGATVVGTTVTVYYKASAGSWGSVGSVDIGASPSGAGYIGIGYGSGAAGILTDNFGGGTLSAGGPSAGTDTATAGLTESLNTVSVTLRIQESG